jgi:hypothetical protein
MSFRQGVIDGKDYIVANGGSGFILTRPLADGPRGHGPQSH